MPNTDSKPTSEKEQTQAPQISPHTPPYTQQIEDDTIDLYELWITLWNKKWLVIAVTAISALGSVVYALLQPFVYKAEALLLPPKANDIQSLSVQGVLKTSSNIVFATFKNNLSSRRLQKKFIEDQGLMDILAPGRTPETRDIEILESFSRMILVEKKEDVSFAEDISFAEGFSVTMESDDPEFAAKTVNDYIRFFDLSTIQMLVAAGRNSISSRIRDIEYTIASKRQMAKQRREDTILRHEEAAVIAGKLGVRDRVDTTNVVQNNQLNISKSSTPLYYRGYRALNAEINILKNRKSDDPFISGLRDLQEKLALLHSIKIEAEGAEPEILEGLIKNLNKVEYITIDAGFERGVNKESTLVQCTNYLFRLKKGRYNKDSPPKTNINRVWDVHIIHPNASPEASETP